MHRRNQEFEQYAQIEAARQALAQISLTRKPPTLREAVDALAKEQKEEEQREADYQQVRIAQLDSIRDACKHPPVMVNDLGTLLQCFQCKEWIILDAFLDHQANHCRLCKVAIQHRRFQALMQRLEAGAVENAEAQVMDAYFEDASTTMAITAAVKSAIEPSPTRLLATPPSPPPADDDIPTYAPLLQQLAAQYPLNHPPAGSTDRERLQYYLRIRANDRWVEDGSEAKAQVVDVHHEEATLAANGSSLCKEPVDLFEQQ